MKQFAAILCFLLAQQLSAQTDFLSVDKALIQSSQEQKPILLIFSGSDWCKPCIQLKENVLETAAFTKFAEELIVLYLDFPYKRANKLSKQEQKHNENLAERYNKNGHFPKSVFIDHTGKNIGEVVYEKGMNANQFITEINKIISIYENEKK